MENNIYIDTSWEAETCCEICNDVIHNHFDCPCCKKEGVGTSIYGDFPQVNEEFTCQNCKSKFKFLGYYEDSYSNKLIQIIENKLDNCM